MALSFKAFWEGIRIKAKSTLTSDTLGEIETSSSTNKTYLHNGTSRSAIVTADQTETLTNKTIDADNNTISNLEVDNLKTGVLNTSTTLTGATDTQIPSALATKTYIEDLAGAVQDNLDDHINDTTGAHAASAISVIPSGNLVSTDAQSALAELDSDITTVQTNLDNHINDTVGAHDASAISVVAIPGVTGDDVQEVLENLKTQIDSSSGDVSGPASSTDNAIVRFDGTTGKVIQNSAVSISDGGAITNATIDAGFNAVVNITDSSIANFAGIDASKIADASVSNTEFQYLNGVTSSIQTQINAKQNLLVNSAGLAAALSDETGNGLAVFNNQPTITNASIQTPSRLDAKQDTLANLTTYALTATNGQFVFSTDTKETFVVKDGQLSSVAGSASSGINYILNPTADTNINGWVTYADAAGTNPVDGTGGSPASTYTRNTTTPLRNTADFLWTKSAANRQGEGFSYDFTIDRADRNKVLQISFDYQIASGTYADNDMTIWIYDVTNATLIQPAPYQLKNVIGSERMGAEFQTSSSLSYRLIVHTSSTSALAYSIQFDNFTVGPQAKLYGSPITDWVSFTPTGSWTANTSYTGRYRRVGDSAEFDITVTTSGTPTATTLLINLPFTIDTSKMTSTTASFSGISLINDSSTTFYEGYVGYISPTSVAPYLIVASGSFGTTQSVTQTTPVAFGAGDSVSLKFKFPILGWGSSTLMSNDANTRVVDFVGYVGVNQALTANVTNITLVSEKDSHGTWAGSSYTIPVSGDYLITTGIGSTTTVTVGIEAYINGAVAARIGVINAGQTSAGAAILPNLKVGDVVTFRSTGAMTTNAGNAYKISISKISGPAQIAASETVAANYKGAPPTGSLGAADNIVTFGIKIKDSHNAYSSGVYTIPISGTYTICAALTILGTFSVGHSNFVEIFIDGTIAGGGYNSFYAPAAGTYRVNPMVSITSIPLLAGQQVTIRSYSQGSSLSYVADGASNFFSITRTGNY